MGEAKLWRESGRRTKLMLPSVKTCHGSTVTRVGWRWCKDLLTVEECICTCTDVGTRRVVTDDTQGLGR